MSQVQQRVDYPFLRISHLPPGVENILSSDVPIATGRGTCPSENLGGIHVHFHSSFFLIFWCFSVRHSDFSSIDYLRRSSLRNPRSTKLAFPTGLASRAGSGVPVPASVASHAELALFQLPRRLADNPGSFTQFNFGESERARIRGGDSTRVRLPRPFPPPSQRGALQAR